MMYAYPRIGAQTSTFDPAQASDWLPHRGESIPLPRSNIPIRASQESIPLPRYNIPVHVTPAKTQPAPGSTAQPSPGGILDTARTAALKEVGFLVLLTAPAWGAVLLHFLGRR